MKRVLKSTKGFSMIELLVALLIMAVIAGIAIALFGNIVGQSRNSADNETAAQIKKQILYYINQANDPDLSCLATVGTTTPNELVDRLCGITVLTTGGTAGNIYYTTTCNVPGFAAWTGNKVQQGEVFGTYGPFFDSTTDVRPQTGNLSWVISVNKTTQQISVSTTSGATSASLLTIN